jgi:hypothetical protein
LHALGRCPPKDALHVASLTNDLRVPTGQLKAGRRVVEFHTAAASAGLGVRTGGGDKRTCEEACGGKEAEHDEFPSVLGPCAGPLRDKVLHSLFPIPYSPAVRSPSRSVLRITE